MNRRDRQPLRPEDILAGIARFADRAATAAAPRISLVVPVYDEVGNLHPLVESIRRTFEPVCAWELVLVDDGSRDGSAAVLGELSRADGRVRVVTFRENCGQSAALAAGIHLACGELIATLDADMQNDPRDLPALLAALQENDAVVGYRVRRNDDLVRRLSSRFANALRNALSKDDIRDTGCSLKVFRAEAIRAIPWFDGCHRFLPTLLRYHGFQVVEHPVGHHRRLSGRSKYGVRNRALRAFLDLLAVRWMRSRLIRVPIVRTSWSAGAPTHDAAQPRVAGPLYRIRLLSASNEA